MSCCRARIAAPPPPVPTRPSAQNADTLRLCNRLTMERTNLVVVLHNGRAMIQHEGNTIDLAAWLALTVGCSPNVRSIAQEISSIYNHALSSGVISRIQTASGNARVSIEFIRHYRG
jgi:hypothetical protein